MTVPFERHQKEPLSMQSEITRAKADNKLGSVAHKSLQGRVFQYSGLKKSRSKFFVGAMSRFF